MRTVKLPMFLTITLLFGCASEDDVGSDDFAESADMSNDELDEMLEGVNLLTLESNSDKKLTPGERTMPQPDINPKGTCSGDIDIYWSACLTEVDANNIESVSLDLNEREQCGDFLTTLVCDRGVLLQGETDCTSSVYCDLLVTEDDESMRCGWRISRLIAKDASSGRTLRRFSSDYIEKLGFELLPIDS